MSSYFVLDSRARLCEGSGSVRDCALAHLWAVDSGSRVEEQVIGLLAERCGRSVSEIHAGTRLREDLQMSNKDALAFCGDIEARYKIGFDRLHRNWHRHYPPELLGWWDWRLNWWNLAALGLAVAAAFGVIPRWSLLAAAIIVAATTAVGLRDKMRRSPPIPLTVGDLAKAASTRKWILKYPPDPMYR